MFRTLKYIYIYISITTTFPSDSCTVYSSRINLVVKFFEFVGQGVVWVTDLRWLTAGVGTAS